MSVSPSDNSDRCHICQYPYSYLKIGTPQDHVLKCKQRKFPKSANCLDGLDCQSRMTSHFQLFSHSPVSGSLGVTAKNQRCDNPLQSSQIFIDLTDSQPSSEEFLSTPMPTPKQRSTPRKSSLLNSLASSRKHCLSARKTPKRGKLCKVDKLSQSSLNQKLNPWTISKQQSKKYRKPLITLRDSDVIDLTQVGESEFAARTDPKQLFQSEDICAKLSGLENAAEQSYSGVKRPLFTQHDDIAGNKRFKSEFSSQESLCGIDLSLAKQQSESSFADKRPFVQSSQPFPPTSLDRPTLDSEDITTPLPRGPGFTPTIPVNKIFSSENEQQIESEEEDLFAMSPQDFVVNAGGPVLPMCEDDSTQIDHKNAETDLVEDLESSDEELPIFSMRRHDPPMNAADPILPTGEHDLTQIDHKNTGTGLVDGLEFSDNEQNENEDNKSHESPRLNSSLPDDEFDDTTDECSILNFASSDQVPFTGPPDAIVSQSRILEQPISKNRGSNSSVHSNENRNVQPEDIDFNNNQKQHDVTNDADGDVVSQNRCTDEAENSVAEGSSNTTTRSTLREQTSPTEMPGLSSEVGLNCDKNQKASEKSGSDSETLPTLSWPSPQKVRVVQRHPGRRLVFDEDETAAVRRSTGNISKLSQGDVGSMLFGLKPVVKEKQKPVKSDSKNQKRGNYVRQCPFYKKIEGTDIAVDAFNYGTVPGIRHYFLTHFHYDHYMGLDKRTWKHKIYCGKVTGNLVVQKLRFREDLIVRLPMWEEIAVGDEHVTVTLLDANHCPGAVLLLFKLRHNRVILHTGDFRASPDMDKYSALQGIKIDTLHLDTTYLNPDYCFPPQSAAIEAAVSVALKCMEDCPKTLFVVGAYLIGKERMFAAIAEAVGSQVYVSADKLRTVQCLEDSTLRKLVTKTPAGCKVHVVQMRLLTVKSLKFILSKYPAFSRIVGIKPTGWTHGTHTDLNAIKPTGTGAVKILQVPYSEHSSFQELRRFVTHTRPRRVIPTVNVANQASRSMMKAFLDEWKKTSFTDFDT